MTGGSDLVLVSGFERVGQRLSCVVFRPVWYSFRFSCGESRGKEIRMNSTK